MSYFSLRTPAVQYLWCKGRWLSLSPHKGRAQREWCRGLLRRSTGTPGPAPTSTMGRWHLWVRCSVVNSFNSMIASEIGVIHFRPLKTNCTLVYSVLQNRSAQTCCMSLTTSLNRTKICRRWDKNSPERNWHFVGFSPCVLYLRAFLLYYI